MLSQGTAGMFGHNLGEVIMMIPEAQTDFIFAVISQNFGFVGASAVIILVFTLDIKLIHTITRSNLEKERIMLIGIVGMLVFQDFQNRHGYWSASHYRDYITLHLLWWIFHDWLYHSTLCCIYNVQ